MAVAPCCITGEVPCLPALPPGGAVSSCRLSGCRLTRSLLQSSSMQVHTSCKASALALSPLSPWCRAACAPFQRSQPSSTGTLLRSQWHIRRERRRRASPAQALLLEQASGLASGYLDNLQHVIAAGMRLGFANNGGPASGGSGGTLAAALLALADLATALQPACFDADCERQKDMLLVARYARWLSTFAARWLVADCTAGLTLRPGIQPGRPSSLPHPTPCLHRPMLCAAWRSHCLCSQQHWPTCCAPHRRAAWMRAACSRTSRQVCVRLSPAWFSVCCDAPRIGETA